MAKKNGGKRLSPIIGEDGRLYYNYGVGAKYSIKEEEKEYIFEIKDCRYSDTNVEYYKCTKNGEPFWNEHTANRLYHILRQGLLETISEGERRELPLMVDEVKAFAYGKATARGVAVKSLGNTDYFAKDKELRNIEIERAFAEAKGQKDKVAELTAKEKALRAKQASILQTKKIDPAILKEAVFCSECNETGVIGGNKVCACAKKLQKEIKDYNAILRRRNQKAEVTE